MKTKLYDFPIKTFNPERLMEEILKRLMEEILNAKDGDIFVVNEKNISPNIGGYEPELTMIQVKKVREPVNHEAGSSLPTSL